MGLFSKLFDRKEGIKDLTPDIQPQPDIKNEVDIDDFDESVNFSIQNQKKIKAFENNMVNSNIAWIKEKYIDKKIQLYKNTIDIYKEFKSFCCSKGNGGKTYFDNIWEHCHNSQDDDFSFIKNAEEQYKYLINNKDIVILKQNKEIKIYKFKDVTEKELLEFTKIIPAFYKRYL
ncbi:hypothetical protein [Clostridium sp.]|jgi:hypothetical protein|uniref:hypothetical protein n=1 Tax=Clostridium sp. TaxID=1506 RepID=UPI0025876482|nr:hypothetical protein [Clostridium sp.]MDF2505110.1 hypothetical protein [Clostridium sp.]